MSAQKNFCEHMKADVMLFRTMQMDDMSWFDSHIDRMMKDENRLTEPIAAWLPKKLFTWLYRQSQKKRK